MNQFVEPFLKSQIVDNLQLNKSNKLNHQTGLITFLQGYCLETGFQVPPNKDLAIQHYLYGLLYFFDPLCAKQLATLLKSKNAQLFCRFIHTSLLDYVYDLDPQTTENIKDKLDYLQEGLDDLQKLNKDSENNKIRHLFNFIIALNQFKSSQTQKNYDYILQQFQILDQQKYLAVHLIIKLITTQTQNKNKYPEKIHQMCIDCSFDAYLEECLFNFQLHGDRENGHTINMRTIIIEMGYLQCTNFYRNVIDYLYNSNVQHTLHRILILRQQGKIHKSESIFKEELKYREIIKTPITLYLCGKHQSNQNEICYFCQCEEELQTQKQDNFINFVYEFYRSKLRIHHNHGRPNKISPNLFDNCILLYDSKTFCHVRTLQFYSIYLRALKQTQKIILKNQQLEFQTLNKLQQLEEQRRKLKLPLRIEKQQTMQTVQQFRSILGPQMSSLYSSQVDQYSERQNYFIEQYSQLNFIPFEEIQDIQFICKCNRDGEIYYVKHNKILLSMRSINFLQKQQMEYFFETQTKIYEHPNIRKIYGYSVQDLPQDDCGNIHILTERYDCNLRAFLRENDKLEFEKLWTLGLGICDAVYYLHSKGILFCNLHPNNILICSGNPILIEFDFDRDIESLNRQYIKEEMFDEENEPNQDTDLYSLGCLLLYIFFRVEFQFEMEYMSTTLTLESFSKINPYTSKNVQFILPPSQSHLQEKSRQMIMAALQQSIDLVDLLKLFYDYI